MNYQKKYLKYKEKYRYLKKNQYGGDAKIGDHVYKIKTDEQMGEIIGYNPFGIFDGEWKHQGALWIYNNTNGNTGYLVKDNENIVWAVRNPIDSGAVARTGSLVNVGYHVIKNGKKIGEIIGENNTGMFNQVPRGGPIWIYNNTNTNNTGYLVKNNENDIWVLRNPMDPSVVASQAYPSAVASQAYPSAVASHANPSAVAGQSKPGFFARFGSWWNENSSSEAAAARPSEAVVTRQLERPSFPVYDMQNSSSEAAEAIPSFPVYNMQNLSSEAAAARPSETVVTRPLERPSFPVYNMQNLSSEAAAARPSETVVTRQLERPSFPVYDMPKLKKNARRILNFTEECVEDLPIEDMRSSFESKFGYTFPSVEATNLMVEHAKGERILSLTSHKAALETCLAARGVPIVCADKKPQRKTWMPVEPLSNIDAVKKWRSQCEIAMSVCPDYVGPDLYTREVPDCPTYEALLIGNFQKIFYIGEQDGSTGSRQLENFLIKNYNEIAQRGSVNWPGVHILLRIYERKEDKVVAVEKEHEETLLRNTDDDTPWQFTPVASGMAAVPSNRADYTPLSLVPVESGMAADDPGRYDGQFTKEALKFFNEPSSVSSAYKEYLTHLYNTLSRNAKEDILSSRRPEPSLSRNAKEVILSSHKPEPSSGKKVVIQVYESENFLIDASNTKEGPFIKDPSLVNFYTISARDFAYCGNNLGLPSFEPGRKNGSSIMLVYMSELYSKMTHLQQKQFITWRNQNKNTGDYDAYFYLQIFSKNEYIKRDFENCIKQYNREELPNGQIHLSLPDQIPLLD